MLGSCNEEVLEDGNVQAGETFYESPGAFTGFKLSYATAEQLVSRFSVYQYPLGCE